MERLIEWLPRHIPPAGPVRLVHGDYRLDNVILHATEPKVLAVLDWELSTLGDPLADFTYHLMQWHMPPEETGAGTGSLVGFDLAALGIPALVGLRRSLRGAHRARSAPASGGLSRLQFLPDRRDPAGHRRPRARRHGDQRACARQGADGASACRGGVAVRPKRRAREENRRAGAWRRRGALAGAGAGARGTRRARRRARRHGRQLVRRGDRGGLCVGHERQGDPPRGDRAGARQQRQLPAAARGARRAAASRNGSPTRWAIR